MAKDEEQNVSLNQLLDVDAEPTPENPRPGALFHKYVGDGFEVTVYPMLYGDARVNLGRTDDPGVENGYCYHDRGLAIIAGMLWDGTGDPMEGWHRNPYDGRQRPNGDPSKEFNERKEPHKDRR